MIRSSLPYIYRLAQSIEPVSNIKVGTKFQEVFVELFIAHSSLETFLTGSIYTPYLRSSGPSGHALLAELKKFNENTDFSREFQASDTGSLTYAFNTFRTALHAELETLMTYLVRQKGGYDTLSLLQYGEVLFPLELAQKVPDAIFDLREAGKCLAFELNTAAGFHVFRATEAVLRKYYIHVTGSTALPKIRNLGVYLHAMKMADAGNAKVRAAVSQMVNLHRNPLIHPEDVLTTTEAMAIFGLAHSAITAMLGELPIPPLTTATPPSGVAPPQVVPGG
jgi:hypothetical protein